MSTPLKSSSPANLPEATVHYSVTADAHPGALPRILDLFALRNITPDLVKVSKYKQVGFHGDILDISIHVLGLKPAEQEIILQKLASHISVHSVREELLFQKKRVKLAF